jgi:hypothetical protein
MDTLNAQPLYTNCGRFFMYLSRLSIFLIEYHASEVVRGFDQFLSKVPDGRQQQTRSMRLRCFCTIASASSMPFRDLNFLLARGCSGTLSLLLQIHAAPGGHRE